MEINEFATKVHDLAITKGWWDEARSFPESIVLIHAELSEAIESWRDGEEGYYFKGDKPDGWAVELADAAIRIFDLLGREGFDAEDLLLSKHKFNEGRPYRHATVNSPNGKRI